MRATVDDIINIMETLAPPDLAESWDNPGLQIGRRDQVVKTLWVALDPSFSVVSSACRQGVDLLITHHPFIFKPLANIDLNTASGKIISLAVSNKLSVFSAHTNLDAASSGINDILAHRIGLKDVSLLDVSVINPDAQQVKANLGLGRKGRIGKKMTLFQLAENLKTRLNLTALRIVGKKDMIVETVALCCGSGSSLLKHFLLSEAEVFVSGDLRYHDARDAEESGKGLIDVGHFASEHLILEVLAERLRERIQNRRLDVAVHACKLENDPFQII
jgi:GTP cyclohydrolase I